MGPLISAEHRRKVLAYIHSASKSGAKLLTGGAAFVPSDPELRNGYFVLPTIFSHCSDDMPFVREEIFGPVAAVLTFYSESEVVRRANSTEYGLAGGVFTKNFARAHRVAQSLQCGTVWINNYNVNSLQVPFGGYKHSGVGRECGREAVEYFTQVKSVFAEMGDVACDYK